MKWVDKHIEVEPPKRPKKITATRFGTVLGCNPWATDFEIWCAVTRTYEKPFEDTVYTIAGKTIEPKQIAYMKDTYLMDNLVTPSDVYGKDYFRKTYGDFFKNAPIFGGMWDSLLTDEKGNPEAVLEFKTTKRVEDWKDDIPEYYAVQAAMYAYLLGVDDVIMVCSFLGAKDYENPEAFVPSAENTITREFKLSERYPDFVNKIAKATAWWTTYVETGISPDYDEKTDAEILAELRKKSVNTEGDLFALVEEAEALKDEVDAVSKSIAKKEKRLKEINELIKQEAMGQFDDSTTSVTVPGSKYVWTVSKTQRDKVTFDEDALIRDGLYDKYTTLTKDTTYRMTVKKGA